MEEALSTAKSMDAVTRTVLFAPEAECIGGRCELSAAMELPVL